MANPELDQAVHDMYARHGYTQPDGSVDNVKVREIMFEVLRPRKVLNLKERGEKAVTRGEMVEKVFPDLPGPDVFDAQDDPQLAQSIWREIDRKLWNDLKTGAGATFQRLVGINMGNGYILCRTLVGKDRNSAAYITDDVRCIETDFVKVDKDALERKAASVVANREMLITRQPQNGSRYARSFDLTLKSIMISGNQQIALTLASVTADNQGDIDSDPENAE